MVLMRQNKLARCNSTQICCSKLYVCTAAQRLNSCIVNRIVGDKFVMDLSIGRKVNVKRRIQVTIVSRVAHVHAYTSLQVRFPFLLMPLIMP